MLRSTSCLASLAPMAIPLVSTLIFLQYFCCLIYCRERVSTNKYCCCPLKLPNMSTMSQQFLFVAYCRSLQLKRPSSTLSSYFHVRFTTRLYPSSEGYTELKYSQSTDDSGTNNFIEYLQSYQILIFIHYKFYFIIFIIIQYTVYVVGTLASI